MIFDYLDSRGISYLRIDHPPVFTCEESERLVPPLDGAKTKNLFLRDGKGRRHFLVSVPPEKNVDLKALSVELQAPGLGFASPERLEKYLKLTPGSVTLLGVINDSDNRVQVVIDEPLWQADALQVHPLINSSTLLIKRSLVEQFLISLNHAPHVISVPGR
jgi:Ala-tRNA(Pro) deacylase